MNASCTLALVGWLLLAVAGFAQTNPPSLLELHVKNVLYVHALESPVVILEDKEQKRFLPIWIGFSEAQSIAMEMYHLKPPRPMTHDLFSSLVKELDAKVERIVITETQKNTYYARLFVTSRGKTNDIDCRPSDGIAIAIRARAPILAADAVMQNALPVPADTSEAQEIRGLGITVQTLTPDLAEAFELGKTKGVLVGASERKEIQRGDVITAVGNTTVETAEQLVSAIEKVDRKREFKLTLQRGTKSITIDVRLPAKD
jgi:bifunctional DNase/RNase